MEEIVSGLDVGLGRRDSKDREARVIIILLRSIALYYLKYK